MPEGTEEAQPKKNGCEDVETVEIAGNTSSTEGTLRSQEQLSALLRELRIANKGVDIAGPHSFWDTQPVPKLGEVIGENVNGSIDEKTVVADVKKEPFKLPQSFVWCDVDVDDAKQVDEIYDLLTNHYVEDDDNLFRFNYSPDFLRWALSAPHAFKDWFIGVRTSSGKMVGFISGIPTKVSIHGKDVLVAEVNFLCVHKKLRTKRLAPVLIKEITRRVNLKNQWQAVYTAGIVLPTPVSTCRYFHRSLNPKKLVEVGFSGLGKRMTMSRCIKLNRVREEPALKDLRPVEKKDVPEIHRLLTNYLKDFKLHCKFTEDEIEHWIVPRPGVVHSYCRSHQGKVTDLISFYELPSTCIGKDKEVKAAYCYYNVATSVELKDLMDDALCLAKKKDFDVFNALDIMENSKFLTDLKFGVGDGHLRYYLYNWRCTQIASKDVGLVLL